jgi:hypothetical protein
MSTTTIWKRTRPIRFRCLGDYRMPIEICKRIHELVFQIVLKQLTRKTKCIQSHLNDMTKEDYYILGDIRTSSTKRWYRVAKENTRQHSERRIKRLKKQWTVVNRIHRTLDHNYRYTFPKLYWNYNPLYTRIPDVASRDG